MKLQPYIMFNGNADEALNFYKEALGAEITFIQKYGEANPEYTSSEMADKIMHANLKWGDFELMISDASENNMTFGTAVNITIAPDSPEAGRKIFEALATGGTIDMPYEKQFWGAYYGMITDKFAVHWMVNAYEQ